MIGSQLFSDSMHLPTLPLAGFWFGDSATATAENVDKVFGIITWICIAFFVLVVGMMIVFIVKYRARPGHVEQPSPSHNNALEIIWSVIPILLVALIFFLGFNGFMDMRTPPADSYDIQVIASKWNFTFQYPNGASSPVLHVPPDRPVRLVQQSADVIHSLFIPAFRIKQDCVPGRYTYQWFTAHTPGEYDLFCAEYCGLDHSNMNSYVKVHESEAAFQEALAELSKPPVWGPDWGEKLWREKGCKTCHSNDGSAIVGGGPTWKDLWDKEETMADGSKVTVDHDYILESIRKPQAKIVGGYQGVNMTAYPESLVKPAEVDAIIAYIQYLSDAYDGPTKEEAEAAAAAAEEGGEATDGGGSEAAADDQPAADEASESSESTDEEPAAPEAGEEE
ncbi:cytochrome c oxidase subunit II [Aeoliella sp. ICT_H6.2]|uniref:Cytochrome c oxidase subunit 2 n=1 Tax=Aeoliella straminimaris TaxID=2954799 RepID=A0A9X2F744_9BACT|nr:cytochrome c oxidase subunit II [Aeoliella straminimaris]MCO6043044.1 cytochrome c oxidase subunit II [Aeoliella straminimaris]